jgi:hypothetical protein
MYRLETKRRAAELVAKDAINDADIAQQCRISPRCLYNWKRQTEFQTWIESYASLSPPTEALPDQGFKTRESKTRRRQSQRRAGVSPYLRDKLLEVLRTLAIGKGRIEERVLSAAPRLHEAELLEVPRKIYPAFRAVLSLLPPNSAGCVAPQDLTDVADRIYEICVPVLELPVESGSNVRGSWYWQQLLWEAWKSLILGPADIWERLDFAWLSVAQAANMKAPRAVDAEMHSLRRFVGDRSIDELTPEECEQLTRNIFEICVVTRAWCLWD